jgi:hypothetical protein
VSGPALPAPPSVAAKWMRALLALAVTVPLGLAPLLGKLDVPGFTAILSLYPDTLRDTALALATFAMALVAVGVQFFADQAPSAARLRRAFVVLAVGLFVLLVTLAYHHTQHVVKVYVGNAGDSVTSVVGSTRLPGCSCAPSDGDAWCLRKIGLDPALHPSCWAERDLRAQGFQLLMLYVALMTGIGALVGLLILKRKPPPRRRR